MRHLKAKHGSGDAHIHGLEHGFRLFGSCRPALFLRKSRTDFRIETRGYLRNDNVLRHACFRLRRQRCGVRKFSLIAFVDSREGAVRSVLFLDRSNFSRRVFDIAHPVGFGRLRRDVSTKDSSGKIMGGIGRVRRRQSQQRDQFVEERDIIGARSLVYLLDPAIAE